MAVHEKIPQPDLQREGRGIIDDENDDGGVSEEAEKGESSRRQLQTVGWHHLHVACTEAR